MARRETLTNHANHPVISAFVAGTAAATTIAVPTVVAMAPNPAAAEERAPFEIRRVNMTIEAKAENGRLKGTMTMGSGDERTEIAFNLALSDRLTPEQIKQVERQTVRATFAASKNADGKFNRSTNIHMEGVGDIPVGDWLDELCERSKLAQRRTGSSAASGRSKNQQQRSGVEQRGPQPGPSDSIPGRAKLLRPFVPGTFYADEGTVATEMATGSPRGFEVTERRNATFYVYGPAKITLRAYPYVYADAKDRTASLPIRCITVEVDGKEYEMSPEDLPAGTIFPTTKQKEEDTEGDGGGKIKGKQFGLWNAPITIPLGNLGPGQHEITVSTDREPLGYRIVLQGADEVSKHGVIGAYALQRPIIEDPNTPASFEFPCEMQVAPDTPKGYQLTGTELSPVPLEAAASPDKLVLHICPLDNSPRAVLEAIRGDLAACALRDPFERADAEKKGVRYRTRPLDPNTPSVCEFERITPPSESTDRTGPKEYTLPVTANGDGGDDENYTARIEDDENFPLPKGMKQAVIGNTLYVWRIMPNGRVRAYRGALDTRPEKLGQQKLTVVTQY